MILLDFFTAHSLNPSVEGDWLDRQRSSNDTPEIRLLRAVLEDAIHSALMPTDKACYESRMWIEDDAAADLFSFNNVCDTLGLAPSAVRRRIMEQNEYKIRPRHGKLNNYKATQGRPRTNWIRKRKRIASAG